MKEVGFARAVGRYNPTIFTCVTFFILIKSGAGRHAEPAPVSMRKLTLLVNYNAAQVNGVSNSNFFDFLACDFQAVFTG